MLCFYWKQIHQGTPHFRITRSKRVFNCTSWQMKLSTLIFCRILLGTGKVEEQWVDFIRSSSVFQSYCSSTQGSLSASLEGHCIKSWGSTDFSFKSRFKLSWSCYTFTCTETLYEPTDSEESPSIYLSLTWIHLSLDMGKKCPEVYRTKWLLNYSQPVDWLLDTHSHKCSLV